MDPGKLTRRHLLLLALVAVAALAGCQSGSNGTDHTVHPDPASDRIGWEDGHWHNDSIAINESNGYNESEREAVVARTMARVEQIRKLEFHDNVSVEAISKAKHRNRSVHNGSISSTHAAYHAQVWEAALILGEDSSPRDAAENVSSNAVAGYYDPESNEIVLVGNESLDTATLAHELTHAVQDQRFNLSADPVNRDRNRARKMVVEGDADLVESHYTDRCGRNWSCIGTADEGVTLQDFVEFSETIVCELLPDCENDFERPADRGYLLTFAQPYVVGETFVERAHERGNWTAVNDLHENYPASTEQVLHPQKYPDEEPVTVTVEDRSTDEWSRFDHDPVTQTLGESVIFVTFADNGVVNRTGNFSSEPSRGWAGDGLVPYRNGSGGHGYVWKVEWDTERDATEFVDAYRSILADRANASADEQVYVLPESDPYGDAFRVVRDEKTVTIVNAPTRSDLSAIHGH